MRADSHKSEFHDTFVQHKVECDKIEEDIECRISTSTSSVPKRLLRNPPRKGLVQYI